MTVRIWRLWKMGDSCGYGEKSSTSQIAATKALAIELAKTLGSPIRSNSNSEVMFESLDRPICNDYMILSEEVDVEDIEKWADGLEKQAQQYRKVIKQLKQGE